MDIARITDSVLATWAPRSADPANCSADAPPDAIFIEKIIATAFEASLLREENRPLTFRLILRCPDKFSAAAGPPDGLLRLQFDSLRPFTAQELRRLTPAVDHDRSLVGVCIDEDQELRIWGIVHSGPRWLEQFHGGRGNTMNLPDSLILGVSDPGYMVISQGSRPLCALEGGVLQVNRLNVFDSKWFPAFFAEVRHELKLLHDAARSEWGEDWTPVDPDFTRMVGRQMIQRLISTIQRSRHGGTLLIVPVQRERELSESDALIRLKYKFAGEEPRCRFRGLIVQMMNALAASSVRMRDGGGDAIGWDEYGRAPGRKLSDIDEAIFELAHMIASLTAVDGAVVVNERFELIGFGGEIAGSLPEVAHVARALDLEGNAFREEPTEDVGTRHRSVYRLVNARRDILGIVVSQDGGARVVRWKNSQVTYWKHTAVTSP